MLHANATEAGATTQTISATFAEPTHPSLGCPGFPDVSCGSGEVIPLGHATEIVVFGAGCGGTCDLRTISLPGGRLVLDETVTSSQCPQVCRPGPLEVGSSTLRDVVLAGTGAYSRASGTFTGTVTAAISNVRPAGAATVKLSGTLTY